MGHGVRLAAQVHDGVRYATGDVNKGKVAQLAVGPVEAGSQLGRELENQARAFRGNLAEARVGHFSQLALVAGADPGAAGGLLVEKPHFSEKLSTVEVGKHHLVAFLV